VLFVPHLLSRAATPAVGSDAPSFALPSQDGNTVSLSDYRGKWVVLYFYPKDQTPG
jgi:thioredoxin-dependent peroxiredoxin